MKLKFTLTVNPGKECTRPAIYNLLFLFSTRVEYTTNHQALAVICGESCSCSSCLSTSEIVGLRSRELANLGTRPRGRGRGSQYREAEVEGRDIARPRPDNGLVPRLCFDRNPTPWIARLLWYAIRNMLRVARMWAPHRCEVSYVCMINMYQNLGSITIILHKILWSMNYLYLENLVL